MEKTYKEFCYKKNHVQQLRGFVNTVKFGSPSKAAKHAGLVYATLTMQIQALERELNTSLFNKKRANFSLTKDGQILYEISVPIIQALENIYENFFRVKNYKKSQQINIASDNFSTSYLLPNIVKKFQNKFSKVKFNLNNLPKATIRQALISDQIDCAIVIEQENYPELEFIHIKTYNLGVTLGSKHPLAKKQQLSLQDLKYANNIIIENYIPNIIIAELKKHNISSNINFKDYSPEMLKLWVKAQTGIAFTFDTGIQKPDLVFKLIKELNIKISYGMLFKKGKYLADNIKNFMGIINQEFSINK
jgi:DNA-binding transcriptional LysR family regulator